MGKVGERTIFVVVKADSSLGELMTVETVDATADEIEDAPPAVDKLTMMTLADGTIAAAAAVAVVGSTKGVERCRRLK